MPSTSRTKDDPLLQPQGIGDNINMGIKGWSYGYKMWGAKTMATYKLILNVLPLIWKI
jgi:hypothetical protein